MRRSVFWITQVHFPQLAAEHLFAVFPTDLTVSGLDLKLGFRYRWVVKRKNC